MLERCSALILAGGLSDRMHFPKAYLLYRNSTFAEKIILAYREAGIDQIYIVMNHRLCGREWSSFLSPLKKNAFVIENHQPEWGRSYSLLLGLNNVMHTEFCFIQNVDNPFVDADLIKKMTGSGNEKGLTVPTYLGKKGHPVLISRRIMRDIIRYNHEDFNMKDLLGKYPQTCVEVASEEILCNINTHEDYFRFIKHQTA